MKKIALIAMSYCTHVIAIVFLTLAVLHYYNDINDDNVIKFVSFPVSVPHFNIYSDSPGGDVFFMSDRFVYEWVEEYGLDIGIDLYAKEPVFYPGLYFYSLLNKGLEFLIVSLLLFFLFIKKNELSFKIKMSIFATALSGYFLIVAYTLGVLGGRFVSTQIIFGGVQPIEFNFYYLSGAAFVIWAVSYFIRKQITTSKQKTAKIEVQTELNNSNQGGVN